MKHSVYMEKLLQLLIIGKVLVKKRFWKKILKMLKEVPLLSLVNLLNV